MSYLAVLDKEGMYEILENFHQQVLDGWELGKDHKILDEINNIVIAGMGGSALPGYILQNYLSDYNIPIQVVEDYFLPNYVNKKTLLFVISYSGTTEEAISAYRDGLKKGAKIITIEEGGKLKEMAQRNKHIHIDVPKGFTWARRLAIGEQFFPMLKILDNSHIIDDQTAHVKKVVRSLQKTDVHNHAESLAQRLVGKIPMIYASNRYAVVARKWKIDINECAKVHAFFNTFPALDHNELSGYEDMNPDYYVVMIRSDDEHPALKKRMDLTKRIIKEKRVDVTEIAITGDDYLSKLFNAMNIGDWVAYYLALEYKRDPSLTILQEEFKKRLGKLH